MAEMERTTLHIVGGDSRSRAEQARIAFALGHHAEIYADFSELLERPPEEGIVLAADEPAEPTRTLIDRLGAMGVWLPVVFVAEAPQIERVVEAIKAGALDYLALPLEMGTFARRLGSILTESGEFTGRRRREVEAQHAIGLLSRREREVLELLSAGCSNKEIARNLAISPRTVEIHRGNMMTKLGAGHAADAVRLWLDARPERTFEPYVESGDQSLSDHERGIAGRIDELRGGMQARIRRRIHRQ
jgi:FixJ family two-component response regulator